MRRSKRQEIGTPGHDSFLDIVANIVGILIILVMVTGVRAKGRPAELAEEEAIQAAAADLEKDRAENSSLLRDVHEKNEQLRQVRLETRIQSQSRAQMATQVALLEKKIEAAREELGSDSRAVFDLRCELAEVRRSLDQLDRRVAAALSQRKEPVLIECLPTPLSKTVEGDEIHFQLRDDRLTHIPLDRLLERFRTDAQQKAYRLIHLPELTETVGPESGFRLRYTLHRKETPLSQTANGQGGTIVQLKKWTLIPVSSDLGETLDECLAEGSRFRSEISGYRPETTTITIWVYENSFATFRTLKKHLYQQGFPTAGRPLPSNVPIGGSPHGTKSAAE